MANRTVSVGLVLEASQYRRGAREVKAETQGIKREVAGLTSEARGLGEEFRKAGGELTKFTRDSSGRLHDERGRFVKGMTEMGSAGGRAGSLAVVGEFGKAFMALPPQAKAAVIGGAVAAAPVLGAAVSAGILAGVAGGTVAAGVAVAFRDPRVKAEAESFGTFLGSTLDQAGKSFVPATIGAIRLLRTEIDKMDGDLRRAGNAGAAFVLPLTRGLAGAAQGALPGFTRALERSGAVVRVVENGMRSLGAAAGDALDSISEGSAGAAVGLSDLIIVTASAVRFTGQALGSLSKLYGFMRIATAVDKTAVIADMAAGEAASAAMKAELDNLIGGLRGEGAAAAGAAADTRSLADAQRDAATAAQEQFGSVTSLRQAINDANAAAKANNAGIDGSSVAALQNREALAALARQTLATRDSTVALKGSGVEANAIMSQGYTAFIKAAMGMSVSKARAHELAVQLGLIPAAKSTVIKTPGLPVAVVQAKALANAISSIDTYKEIQIVQRLSTRGVRVAGVTGRGGFFERDGGVTLPAREGLLREPTMFGTRGPARFAFAEPGTQGEAFIPRNGNTRRAVEIGRQAMSWHGQAVVPKQLLAAMGGRSGGSVLQVNVNVPPTAHPAEVGRHVVEAIQQYERRSGASWRT